MQRIERYGVIALVFLLVTVAAVSFWGDGAEEGRKAGSRGDLASADPAAARPPAPATRPSGERRPGGRPVAEKRTEAPLPVGEPTDPRKAAEAAKRAADPRDEFVPLEQLARAEPDVAARDERRRDLPRAKPASEEPAPPRVSPEPRVAREGRAPSAEKLLPETEVEVLGGLRAPRSPQTVEYTVRPGDTLSGIALATLGSTTRWRSIQDLNAGLDPTRLKAGQKLLLPKGAVFGVAPGTPPAEAKQRVNGGGRGGHYVIRKGDVLSKVAEAKLGSAARWREIVALNPGLDPNRLLVGTRIALPAGAVDAAPVPVSPSLASATPAPRGEKEFKVR